MRPFLFIATLLLACTISCSSQEDLSSTTASATADTKDSSSLFTPVTKAKTLVENNTYIDVDMEAFHNAMIENFDRKNPQKNITAQLYPEEYEMVRAAMYRYYSKIILVDGLWVCTAKEASELNMSERTFKFVDDNIKKMHEQGEKAMAEGMTVKVPAITADYLKFLIK